MTARGKFITLEGPEGAGKSTQAKLLADVLKARGRPQLLHGFKVFFMRIPALSVDRNIRHAHFHQPSCRQTALSETGPAVAVTHGFGFQIKIKRFGIIAAQYRLGLQRCSFKLPQFAAAGNTAGETIEIIGIFLTA